MKDGKLRAIILQKYYDQRTDLSNEGFINLTSSDFDGEVSAEDIFRISTQLYEHGFIDWRTIGSTGNLGRITATGVDVVEQKGKNPSLPILFDFSQNINVLGSTNVHISDSNFQNVSPNLWENPNEIITRISKEDSLPQEFTFHVNTPTPQIVQDSASSSGINIKPQVLEVITESIDRGKGLEQGFEVNFKFPGFQFGFKKPPNKEVRTATKKTYRPQKK